MERIFKTGFEKSCDICNIINNGDFTFISNRVYLF